MKKDALASHARDELGFSEETTANPLPAAGASAGQFSLGAALPTGVAYHMPKDMTLVAVSGATILFLVVLGARLGGAGIIPPALRVGFWSAIALAVTAGIGALIGRPV